MSADSFMFAMPGFQPEDEPPRTTILPEAALMEIQAAAPHFLVGAQPRFAVGDLVIPKPNGLIKRDDELPRIVVAVRPDAEHDFSTDPRSPHFGMRYDIRVLGYNNDCLIAFWCESAYYEAYQGEGAVGHDHKP